ATDDQRARREGGGLLCSAVQYRRTPERLERGSGRCRVLQLARAELPLPSRRIDLQRHERDPAQYHRQARIAALTAVPREIRGRGRNAALSRMPRPPERVR